MQEFNVTEDQFQALIQLTEPSLKPLDFKFIIVKNNIDFRNTAFYQSLNTENRNRLDRYMSYTSSLYIASENLLIILLDDIKGHNYRDKAINFSSTLFHEIRHVWQNKKKLFDFGDSLNPNENDYNKQPHEVDAISYQLWATNTFKKEISKIFNIDQDWSLEL